MKIIAVDLGGTNLRVALVKRTFFSSKIIRYVKTKTPKNKEELLRDLVSLIKHLDSNKVRGVGISCAGPLLDGVIKNPPNLPLKNFNLQSFLQKKFKKKVVIENDANCVAIAEAKYGCKKSNFIILTLGTGVGGGIIINKKLYTGEGFGGELGHIILDNKKDFEDLWRRHRIESKKYFGKVLLIKDLIKRGDKKSKKIVDQTLDYLGQGIASLINIFDPEVVVLTGGVKETGDKFLSSIRKKVPEHVLFPRKTPIIWSNIEDAGILGASLLI